MPGKLIKALEERIKKVYKKNVNIVHIKSPIPDKCERAFS